MKQLRKASIEALTQTRTLLDVLVNHPQGQKLYEEGSIGKHIRHIVDHYLVLRDGLGSESVESVGEGTNAENVAAQKVSCIDYNQRNRDSEMERNIFIACNSLDELSTWLETSPLLDYDKPVTIIAEISCQQIINASINSNLKRELHYVNYHCIHHLAFCALIAKQQGIEMDSVIGLAPGTASYMRAIS